MSRNMVKMVGCVFVCMLIAFSTLFNATNKASTGKFSKNFVGYDDHGVELSCDESYHTIPAQQGASTTFIVTITNTGTLDDTYDITAGSIEDIICLVNGKNADQFNPYEITLVSGESTTFEVTAEIWEDVQVVPIGEWAVIVEARSQNDTNTYDVLELTVNVKLGLLCGYVYASDGTTPLEEASVTYDQVDCVWYTDENGYYQIDDIYWEGQLDIYAYPPYDQSNQYLPLFKIAEINKGETCWVNFTLEDYRPNTSPENFQIKGSISCKVGEEYEYTFSSEDSENDQIYFMISWGDDPQAYFTFYTADPEGKIIVSKIWDNKGSYTIRGCAIDKYGFYSNSDSLAVSVPKNKQKTHLLFHQLFNKFPMLARLLNLL